MTFKHRIEFLASSQLCKRLGIDDEAEAFSNNLKDVASKKFSVATPRPPFSFLHSSRNPIKGH